ncbi:hypothetical protein GUJ93_ZPchr0009g640 [Zizania palustris]|uniref:Uncharacterized protein n=1 Tax=Zizania palustris TaxID=103762 RepID=A0A8J5V5U6_ZIZPA|nr:hypothetical protein GUJ93_ZPchr0009g640 [Zizania palustris]
MKTSKVRHFEDVFGGRHFKGWRTKASKVRNFEGVLQRETLLRCTLKGNFKGVFWREVLQRVADVDVESKALLRCALEGGPSKNGGQRPQK